MLSLGLGLGVIGRGGVPFSSVSFLSGFEGADGATTFIDESSYANVLTTNGNAQIDTAQFKFGVSSYLGDGTGDYITTPDNAIFEFGSGSWTIEGFVRFSAIAAFGPVLVAKHLVTGNQRSFRIDYKASGSNEWGIRLSATGADQGVTLAAADVLTTATWYHFCAEYDAATTTLRMYRDGVMKGKSVASRSLFNGTAPLSIAADASGNNSLNGWLDELRITKGVARYASDSGFPVPTTPYPRS